mmetsp:Transcript_87361/g.245237  ORF Transcript_87361/g.245237 Transcript_87361/m.245237 type:complete len:225 (+) Transcript_87361:144-818(+)
MTRKIREGHVGASGRRKTVPQGPERALRDGHADKVKLSPQVRAPERKMTASERGEDVAECRQVVAGQKGKPPPIRLEICGLVSGNVHQVENGVLQRSRVSGDISLFGQHQVPHHAMAPEGGEANRTPDVWASSAVSTALHTYSATGAGLGVPHDVQHAFCLSVRRAIPNRLEERRAQRFKEQAQFPQRKPSWRRKFVRWCKKLHLVDERDKAAEGRLATEVFSE